MIRSIACVSLGPGGDRGHVDDLPDLVSMKHFFEKDEIGNVALNEKCLGEEGRRDAQVEDQDFLAARQELLGDVQADEARAARQQDHFL